MNKRALIRALKSQIRVAPNEMRAARVAPGQRIGSGRSKTVYADPQSADRVIVDMQPHVPTETFLDFARDAHARGLPIARHLPNPSAAKSTGDGIRFGADRLEPNPTRVRIGREGDEFYITGMADDDPQRETLLETVRAIDAHLKSTLPKGKRFYFDLSPQNFMRRRDGTLVINDPVESVVGAAIGGGALAEALRRRERKRGQA